MACWLILVNGVILPGRSHADFCGCMCRRVDGSDSSRTGTVLHAPALGPQEALAAHGPACAHCLSQLFPTLESCHTLKLMELQSARFYLLPLEHNRMFKEVGHEAGHKSKQWQSCLLSAYKRHSEFAGDVH